jgi:hypothetical protein
MEYRWYIGKELNTEAGTLIDFTQASWNDLGGGGGGWSWAADQLTHLVGGAGVVCDAVETKNNIFTVGETYQISFEYDNLINYPAVKPYIGDFTLKKWECFRNDETKVFDAYCRAGQKMRFTAAGSCKLNTLTVYPYVWMSVLTGENCPKFENKKFINLQKSENILAIFIKNLEKVVFYGGSYQRLRSLVNADVYEIPVKVQARQSKFSDWFDVFLGTIYANEIIWDTKTSTALCDIEDASESQIILKNIDKLTKLTFYDGRRWNAANPTFFTYLRDQTAFHNPSSGAYDIGTGSNDVYRVNEVLREFLYENTDLRVGLTSTTLATASGYESGAPAAEYAGLTNMKLTQAHPFEPIATTYITIETTLKELIAEYNKLFAVQGYVDTNAVKSLVVEKLATLQTDSGLTFTGINDLIIEGFKIGEMSIDIGFVERNYKGDTGVLRLNEIKSFNDRVLDLSSRYFAGNDYYQRIAGASTDVYQNYHYRLQSGETPALGGRLTPIKNSDKIFLVEYVLGGANYQSVQGAVNLVYNPRFEPVNWITRHLPSILSTNTYKSDDNNTFWIYSTDNDFEVTGTNDYIYKCTFSTVLSWANYLTILTNPFAYITIQSGNINPFTGLSVNSKFIIESMKYDPESGSVEFEGYIT